MTQPETQPREGNPLTAKVGPLPTWGWIAIAAAGGIGVLLWLQSHRAKQQQPTNTTEVQGVDTATLNNVQDALSTVEAQIRDLQGGPSQPPTAVPIEGIVKLPKNVNLYDWVKQQQGQNPNFPDFLSIEQRNPDLAKHLLWKGDKSPYTPYVQDDVAVKVS